MSHDATAWAKAQKTGNSPAKFILMVLADFAGTDYSCYPSVKKLADITELSESTVRLATKKLAEDGLIRVFYRYRDNHTRRSSRYQLLVDGPETMEPDAEDWAHQRRETAEVQRREPEGTPQLPADSQRQLPAVIPLTEPSLREPSPVIPAAPRPMRATRLPKDFAPDEKMRAWFAEQNLAAVIDGRTEHEKFCDYFAAAPGVRGQKVDWPATWRNWMRTAAERVDRRRPGSALSPVSGAPARHYPSTTDAKVMQTLALAEKYRQMEENP